MFFSLSKIRPLHPNVGFVIEGSSWRYNLLQLETTRWAQSWPDKTCRAACISPWDRNGALQFKPWSHL